MTKAGTAIGTALDVSVIGLGMMGSALAQAFIDGGKRTTVWNRSADKAERVVAAGGQRAMTPADAFAASPVVVACLRDYDAVREVLDAAGDALAGRTLVNLTSGASHDADAMAELVATRQARYLDGAIMMTPPGIGGADTVILYSGPADVFDAHADLLRTLGGATTYLGPRPGTASLFDVALLGMMWATLNGFLHAVALVGTDGVDASEFLPFATGWHDAVGSFMPGLATEIDARSYAATEATLETQLPPANHLVDESQSRGVDTGLPRFTQSLIADAVKRGHGLDSYARIVESFQPGRDVTDAR